MQSLHLAFVHGYSVTSFDTYGQFPVRVAAEARARGLDIRFADVRLARYVSFSDAVRLDDLALGLEKAIADLQLPPDARLALITHSTGGPLVRNWFDIFYADKERRCPMRHLVMLAPANFGSALAQLGKTKLSRMRSWLDGVEPGQNILDWLELGSHDGCALNIRWMHDGAEHIRNSYFPFVLMGQDIDRHLYDHVNSYTGEPGSDGVVRVSAANLNGAYLKLMQGYEGDTSLLSVTGYVEGPRVPLRVLTRQSHSNSRMGIMKSVAPEVGSAAGAETVDALFRCLAVNNRDMYAALFAAFELETKAVQDAMRVEHVDAAAFSKTYIRDRYSMIVFRLTDSSGQLMNDFDVILTSSGDNPDALPPGFFGDRQRNLVDRSVITYYFNYDVMAGMNAVHAPDGSIARPALPGAKELGLLIRARPDDGFIHYRPCRVPASAEFLHQVLRANSTTIIDIVLQRVVNEEVFRFEGGGESIPVVTFNTLRPGKDIG